MEKNYLDTHGPSIPNRTEALRQPNPSNLSSRNAIKDSLDEGYQARVGSHVMNFDDSYASFSKEATAQKR